MDVSLEINKNNGNSRASAQGAVSRNGTGSSGSDVGIGENTLAACLKRWCIPLHFVHFIFRPVKPLPQLFLSSSLSLDIFFSLFAFSSSHNPPASVLILCYS